MEWPLSIFRPAPKLPIPGTDRLMILRVDFPVSAEKEKGLEQMLQPLREKYGLDFLVLEPGMTLSRFDDI